MGQKHGIGRAGRFECRQLVRRAARRNHPRAQRLGEIARRQPHPAARAVDQHPLPGLEAAQFDQRSVSSAVSCAERCGLLDSQTRRNLAHCGSRNCDPLGKAPGLAATINEVAGVEVAVDRGFDDLTGKFQAEHKREGRFELILALGHQQIGEVE